MWCGIGAIVMVGFAELQERASSWYPFDWTEFVLLVFFIALVTGGLIYTFRDKQGKKNKSG
jgi:hypothetical protein